MKATKTKKQDPRIKIPHDIVEAGDNIFEALGFTNGEAAELLMRSQLMMALKKWRQASKMTQTAAAKELGVTQARLSDLERGKFNLFSLDMLVRMADRAGLQPQLKLAA